MAIDDISFTNCNAEDYLLPVKCNFEIDFCGWSNDLTADFNWSRNQGVTPTFNTGPSGDQ